MQTYKEFTAKQDCYADFTKGKWDNWLLAPCSLQRDSSELRESNWEVQLDRLNQVGTQEEDFVILRASHWLVGWIDRLLVRPDSPCVAVCEDIEAQLADYPVLDVEDFSQREEESYLSAWANGAGEELLRLLVKKGKLTEEQADALSGTDLREWFEDCMPSGDYYGEGCYPRLHCAGDRCGTEEIEKLLTLS